jgi:hypothetical protein
MLTVAFESGSLRHPMKGPFHGPSDLLWLYTNTTRAVKQHLFELRDRCRYFCQPLLTFSSYFYYFLVLDLSNPPVSAYDPGVTRTTVVYIALLFALASSIYTISSLAPPDSTLDAGEGSRSRVAGPRRPL